jgi:pimeloyl-ACP methyl ester carboxylesterase
MYPTKQILWQENSIAYQVSGWGNRTLLCFHGYGESKSSFNQLVEKIGDQFTCISVDLPFHGETNWCSSDTCSPDEWSTVIDAILSIENRKTSPLALLAYSMGGRIALCLVSENKIQVDQLWLLAPDGLVVNPWYWLSTQTKIGQWLFRTNMEKPDALFYLMKKAHQWGWLNTSIFKFTKHYVQDVQARQQLYQRWTGMRLFALDEESMLTNIQNKQTKITLIYGQFDKIILPHKGMQLAKQAPNLISVHTINSGHQLLQPRLATEIASIILQEDVHL